MSEFQSSCQNGTQGFFNRFWSEWHHYQLIGAAETIILPCLTGTICSTGLVGNILVVLTIIRTEKKTIPDIYICNLAIADLVCVIGVPFLIHQWARGVAPPVSPGRVMRLTKMVLALVSVSVVSAAPFHMIQLMNLQVSQPTLTFYVSYYVSICRSCTSSFNPFLYILPTGNFQKHLRPCTKVEVRMAEEGVSIIENILKANF